MTRVLITGGAGFVGANLALALAARHPDWEVVALDNLQAPRLGAQPAAACARPASRSSTATCARPTTSLALEPVDAIVECSAEPSVLAGRRRRPDYLVQTNLVGAYNCLELAAPRRRRSSSSSRRAASTRSRRSTRSRYEEARDALRAARRAGRRGRVAARDRRGLPARRRAHALRRDEARAELLIDRVRRRRFGLRTVVNRCGVVAGPWQMGKVDQGVFTYWMLAHHFGRPLRYIGFGGTGKQVRDLLHVDDLVDLRRGAARRARTTGRARRVNVGGGPRVSPVAASRRPRSAASSPATRSRSARPRETARATCRSTSRTARALFAHTDWRPRRSAARDPRGHLGVDRASTKRSVRCASARDRSDAMPTAIVTGSGGLIGSESVAPLRASRATTSSAIENDMRARFFGPRPRRARRPSAWSASSTTFRSLELDIRDADGVERALRRATRATRARRPHRRAAVARLGGLRPADRLRRQRQRHAEPARGDAHARARRDVHLHLDQQGLRRPPEPPAAASSSRRGSSCPRTTATTAASTRRCRSTAATHSLFGVSKAAADLLVQEYGRYFDMPTVCFRGGCLTGPAPRRRPAARLPLLPDAVHGHRRRRTRSSATAASRCATTSTPPTSSRAFAAFHAQPARRPPSTTSAAGAQSNCSMLEAIALCERIAGRELDWTLSDEARIGDHRWWISDLDAVPARLPGLAARATTSRTILREIHDAQRRALDGRGAR